MSQRFVLAIHNTGDTPLSRVSKIHALEILNTDGTDVFIVYSDCREICAIRGEGLHQVDIPEGSIKISRHLGNSPVTIFAYGTPSAR
jgi:hypothetical protein